MNSQSPVTVLLQISGAMWCEAKDSLCSLRYLPFNKFVWVASSDSFEVEMAAQRDLPDLKIQVSCVPALLESFL